MRAGAECGGRPWLQMRGEGGIIILAACETKSIEYELKVCFDMSRKGYI